MRLPPRPLVLAFVVFLLSTPTVFADGGPGGGAEPSDPMSKGVTLYLASDLTLSPEPSAGNVPASPATPDGASTPTVWTAKASKAWTFDASLYLELYVTVEEPTLTAGGPDGASFVIQLLKNGEPVEGAWNAQRVDGGALLLPGAEHRMKVFLPKPEVAFAPGDELGLGIQFFGLQHEARPGVSYKMGGESGSRLQFRLRYAGVDQLDLPKEVGAWPVAPLRGFDFDAARKVNPDAKVFTLKAFQFGFHGAPIVVPNGSTVILQLTVDERLGGAAAEGHGGHGAHGSAGGESQAAGPFWDQNPVAPLHGFTLAALDPKLSTVLFDGLVVTVTFDATKPGDYMFTCTVFCGTGHGAMLDRLTIEGPSGGEPAGDQALQPTNVELGAARTPGTGVLGLLGALIVAAALLTARRRA